MKHALISLIPRRATLGAGLIALALGMAAHAEPPSDWWVDIVNDRVAGVREELARGADPNALNDEELPSLMLAIRSGAWEVYDALLAHRATQVEVENKHRETPLMYLALLGETKRAAALIEKGAQVNRLGWTPLHYAASRGQTETARMLIEKGAIINSPAPDGTTPLMMAAFAGDRDTVQLLLDHGADATAININKHTAADWARERRHVRLGEELDAVAKRTVAQREGRVAPTQPVIPEIAPAPSGGNQPATGGQRLFDLDRFERDD